MIPTAFDEENGVLDGPQGTTSDEVGPLSVWRGRFDNGQPCVISCWRPTKEEMEEIQKTGRIWITILGRTMPPILPLGISPFDLVKPRGEESCMTDNDKHEADRLIAEAGNKIVAILEPLSVENRERVMMNLEGYIWTKSRESRPQKN
jgi:hypothetical protein